MLIWPQLLQQVTISHTPSISHPPLSTSEQPHQLQSPCLAPYLRLLEELAALLVLDVGDLTILYLGTRAAVRLH